MQTSANHVEQIIVEYVKSIAIMDSSQVIPLETSLVEANILDSVGIVDVLTFVENRFEISIPDEDMTREKLGSIRKMALYVESYQTAR